MLSVLTKVLIKKEKITNSLLVTVVAQFTAKTANSERAIYSLSLMPYSIDKVKLHMLFWYKNVVFFHFTWKNFFVPGIGEGTGALTFPYSTVNDILIEIEI